MIRPGALNYGNPVNWSWPLNNGLQGWWLCLPNWIGGATWRDLTGRHPGTLTNMEVDADWFTSRARPGGFGYLDFGGSNEWVSVTTIAAPTDKTFSAWINFDTFAGGFNTLMEFGADSPWFGLSGTATCGVFGGGFTSALAAGTWHWVCYTSDQTANTSQMYVNGLANGTASTANTNTGSALGIGWNGGDTAYDGRMDSVKVYNRSFTASDIYLLYVDELRGHARGLNRMARRIVDVPAAAGGANKRRYSLTLTGVG